MYTKRNVIKTELVDIGRRITSKDLVIGPGGNTSARLVVNNKNIIYLKASGKCFEDAKVNDYVGVDLKTENVVDGKLKPTCEINMHLICYHVRNDVHAVVHTHPTYATAYGMLEKSLKAFTPDFIAVVGLEVPVVKYTVPAGKELALGVSKHIKNNNAVFLMNHGLLTVGSNLKEAFYRTLIIEDAAKTYFVATMLGKFKLFTIQQAQQIDNLDAERYRRKLLK